MHRTTIRSWRALLREGALSRGRFLRAAAGTVGVLVLVGAGLLLPTWARADDENDDRPIRTTSGFKDFPAQQIVKPGTSTLTRTEEGVSIRVHIPGLTPGNVYTFWMVEVQLNGFLHGGRVAGLVLGESGVANVKVEAEVGDILGDFHIPGSPLQAAPLTDPLHSTFWLVVRNHGPASSDPAELYLQLHTHQTTNPAVTDYGISVHVPPP
jgi:hypothetical protein